MGWDAVVVVVVVIVVLGIGCWATNWSSLGSEEDDDDDGEEIASGFFDDGVMTLKLIGGVDDDRWKGRIKKLRRFDSGFPLMVADLT